MKHLDFASFFLFVPLGGCSRNGIHNVLTGDIYSTCE